MDDERHLRGPMQQRRPAAVVDGEVVEEGSERETEREGWKRR